MEPNNVVESNRANLTIKHHSFTTDRTEQFYRQQQYGLTIGNGIPTTLFRQSNNSGNDLIGKCV